MKLSPSVSGCHEVARFNMHRWAGQHTFYQQFAQCMSFCMLPNSLLKLRLLYEKKMTIILNNFFVRRQQTLFTFCLIWSIILSISYLLYTCMCYAFFSVINNRIPGVFFIITNRFLENFNSCPISRLLYWKYLEILGNINDDGGA